MKNQIVDLKNFILSTRDSGYKSISYALAEIIDNSFEAEANDVKIFITNENKKFEIAVIDNGIGMHPNTLALSLRFGGTTRFKSTNYFGRYGMGLPNSSFSQCRRLEVYSWKKSNSVNWNYLDIDEIVEGKYEEIPKSKKRVVPTAYKNYFQSGTLVVWKKIDRLRYKTILPILNKLHQDLGKIYRSLLFDGKSIIINQHHEERKCILIAKKWPEYYSDESRFDWFLTYRCGIIPINNINSKSVWHVGTVITGQESNGVKVSSVITGINKLCNNTESDDY